MALNFEAEGRKIRVSAEGRNAQTARFRPQKLREKIFHVCLRSKWVMVVAFGYLKRSIVAPARADIANKCCSPNGGSNYDSLKVDYDSSIRLEKMTIKFRCRVDTHF